MPSVAEIEAIETTLKASLGRSKELDQNVASAAQRVLLQNIEFIPADKPHSMQLRYTYCAQVMALLPCNISVLLVTRLGIKSHRFYL